MEKVTLAALGGALALAAYLVTDPAVAGICWAIAVGLSAFGYGLALERCTKVRTSSVVTLVTGLALLLLASRVLSLASLLTYRVQLGLVIAGLAGAAALGGQLGSPRRSTLLFIGVAGAISIAMASVLRDVVTIDDFDHAFVVKRLWDTGSLGATPHQVGLQLVGQSYFALMVDARAVGIFELGACSTLVLMLLAERVTRRDLMFAIATPLAIGHGASEQWCGIALVFAAFCALERGARWHAVVLAVALGTLRHEYLLIAVPIAAGAFPFGLDRRRVVGLLVGWAIATFAIQLMLSVAPLVAARNAIALLSVVPFLGLLLHLAGRIPWRSPLAIIAFGAVSSRFALRLDAIHAAQHGDSSTFVVWVALALCLFALVDHDAPDARPLAPGAAALLGACFIVGAVTGPNFSYQRRDRISTPYTQALLAYKRYRALGDDDAAARELRQLEERVPAGSAIAFWGRSVEDLDFARHRVIDISIPLAVHRNRTFLMRIEPMSLEAVDYLLLENLDPSPKLDPQLVDPFGAPGSATQYVDDLLETVAMTPSARLCRVREH